LLETKLKIVQISPTGHLDLTPFEKSNLGVGASMHDGIEHFEMSGCQSKALIGGCGTDQRVGEFAPRTFRQLTYISYIHNFSEYI